MNLRKRTSMNRRAALQMVGSGAALAGLALAKQAPEAQAQASADHPIVGAWTTHAVNTTVGIQANLIAYIPGGIVILASSTFPISAGIGAWADAGDGTFVVSLIWRRMDAASGAYIGSTRLNGRGTVAADGASYSVTFSVELSDPQENVTSTGQGSAQSTRIVPTPPTS